MKQKDQPIVLAYFDPAENTMVTRSISGPRKVPELIGKNLEEIEVILNKKTTKHADGGLAGMLGE